MMRQIGYSVSVLNEQLVCTSTKATSAVQFAPQL